MALVTKMKIRIPVPHEEGEWFEIRRLSAKQLEDSAKTRTMEAAEITQAFGADIYRVSQEMREKAEAENEEDPIDAAAQDPLTGHHRWTILRHGVFDWSYTEDKPKPRDLEELDNKTANWLARAILLYTDRPDITFGPDMPAPIMKALYDGKGYQEALDEEDGIVEISGNVVPLDNEPD